MRCLMRLELTCSSLSAPLARVKAARRTSSNIGVAPIEVAAVGESDRERTTQAMSSATLTAIASQNHNEKEDDRRERHIHVPAATGRP